MLHTPAFIYYSNHLILNFLLLNAILNLKKTHKYMYRRKTLLFMAGWADWTSTVQIRSFIDAQLKEY